jgi:peptide deformylase
MLLRRLPVQYQRQEVHCWGCCSSLNARLPKSHTPHRFINFFSKSSFPKGEQDNLKLLMLGDPNLRKRSDVVSFDSGILNTLKWITPLSRDMGSLMRAQYGAGLAAPQIGRNLRMFLMDETDPDEANVAADQVDPVVVINPKILKLEGSWEFDFEGCLSVPLLAALVPRATTAHVSYVDASGNSVSRELRGWAARIFQHEVGLFK